MGDPNRLWQALANHGEGDVTEPIRVDGETYIFQITSHRPPRPFGLEEARKRVEADLTRERVEKAYKELVQQALQASEVKLFPERIRKDAREEAPGGPSPE
jgi:parvulin-like peptidyl-prolyl isomerase